MRPYRISVVLLLSAIALGCAQNAVPRGDTGLEASLLGTEPLIIPYQAEVDGLAVGGLSGLIREPGGTWLAVIDNQVVDKKPTPARIFRLAFAVTAEGAAPLPGETVLQIPKAAIRLTGFDGDSLDGEGIALEASGRILVSSEKEPSIRAFSPAGEPLAELPVPEPFLASVGERGVRGNAGFESLNLSPDGALWTANELPLKQDAPEDVTRRGPVRLLRYDQRGDGYAPAAQYVYELERIATPGPKLNIRGLVDLLVLPEGGLLALEREFVEGRGLKVELYHVSLDRATDVSGLDSLSGATWQPVEKARLYDFTGAGFAPDNIEGLAWGPVLPDGARTVVLLSDNNFNSFQRTQIVVLRLVG